MFTYFARYTSPHAGAKTVILSENREGWIYAFFSIWLNRGIAVPVDATATPDEVAYTLRDSEAECIWTSNKKLDTAREALRLLGRELPILIIDEHEQVELSDDIRPAKIDYESSATAVIIYTMWRMRNGLMAGPFICHIRLDEVNKRVVFAEGFCYAPNDGKRLLIRNLEASLYTLKLPSDQLIPEIEVTLE